MGVLDIFSSMMDLFEIGRKTTSDVKSNKPKERKYDFSDEGKMPTSKSEYNKTRSTNIPKSSKKSKNEEGELEL